MNKDLKTEFEAILGVSVENFEKIFQKTLKETPEVTFIDPELAFQEAISDGRLTLNPKAKNCVFDYMYMLTKNGKHQFKHVITRQYL